MRNLLCGLGCVVLLSSVGGERAARAAAQTPQAAPAAEDVSLELTVTYKGKGEVKPGNEIAVFLFDTPEINAQSMPIGAQILEKNGGVLRFANIAAPTVYIALVYDEQGTYEEHGPPPTGTPTKIYSDESGTALGVKTGKGAKASVTFDDSVRMP